MIATGTDGGVDILYGHSWMFLVDRRELTLIINNECIHTCLLACLADDNINSLIFLYVRIILG